MKTKILGLAFKLYIAYSITADFLLVCGIIYLIIGA
jgi:hypothetical protein